MFSLSDYDFMTTNMKIVVSSIESKFNEPFFIKYQSIAISSIAKYIEEIKKSGVSGITRDLLSDNTCEEIIRLHYCNLVEQFENDEVEQVFDALRHAFSNYAVGGLRQLYIRQENENWYPKIILTEILIPNDIDSLDKTLTLYRGCNINELDNRDFGQAWTTDLKTAEEFAYTHYSNQRWFDKEKRAVLKTTYSRDDVLFSVQSIEYEVVIDTSKIGDVQKYQ